MRFPTPAYDDRGEIEQKIENDPNAIMYEEIEENSESQIPEDDILPEEELIEKEEDFINFQFEDTEIQANKK